MTENSRTPDPLPAKTARTGPTVNAWQCYGVFLVVSLGITLMMFWPAISGQKLLAPVDIAPNFFSKYRYADPTANGIPANHYIIDLMLGDLSRNWLVHEAWKRGETPWWDPYTDSGKPLAAEANAINISDPWKNLIFRLLPFERAYNWIRIVPFLLSGIAAFCLLRHLGFSNAAAIWGGLLYQFAGCNVMMFSGPTAQATFAYYPWLWLIWDRGMTCNKFSWFAGSSVIAGLAFLSGNLQSHTYAFLFALAFVIGYGWKQSHRWRLLVTGVTFALGAGLCLAAPFILPQVELYLSSVRKVSPAGLPISMLSGVASLVAFFPWLFGTFRTLDFSKIFTQQGLGFWIYIGSAAMVLALLGGLTRTTLDGRRVNARRTALALIAIYFIVCSTPLLNIFYTRTAWLAVLGLIVLFALGWSGLAEKAASPRWGWVVISAALLIAVAINVGGFVVFPRLQTRIEERVRVEEQTNRSLDRAPALRKFQITNWPDETTFKNPETVLAFASLLVLGTLLVRRPSSPLWWLHMTLMLSTFPLLWFAHRYIPMQPVALWEKIRDGGPEQHRLANVLVPKGMRLRETAEGQHEYAFPGAMAQLYGVHVMHGHSSLLLRNAGQPAPDGTVNPQFHDYEYRNSSRGLERGELLARTGSPARFQWSIPSERTVSIASETLCTIDLDITSGSAGDLIRTDTYYPGWRVVSPASGVTLQFEPPNFARLHIPADVTRVRLEYVPRWLQTGIFIAAGAGVLIVASFMISARPQRNGIKDG